MLENSLDTAVALFLSPFFFSKKVNNVKNKKTVAFRNN